MSLRTRLPVVVSFVLSVVALVSWGTSLGYAVPPTPQAEHPARPPAKSGDPKLDSTLNALVATYQQSGASQAQALAQAAGLQPRDTTVRVVLEMAGGSAELAGTIASRAGGSLIKTYGQLAQVEAPIPGLPALAQDSHVRKVRRPFRPQATVTSQGVALSGADVWQAAGYRGGGVKVAIVDLGFQGYTSQLGGELPATVNTVCNQQPLQNGERHGVAVAEVVHDMAPAATLYLVNINDEIDLGNAVDCLIENGVSVANHSVAWGYEAAGDGTGVVNDIISRAVSGGIFWANSAGNYQQKHWAGPWSDPDSNGWLNFANSPGIDEGNTIRAGGEVCAFLRWDDPWGASTNDYDLYLKRSADGSIVYSSTNLQNGQPGSDPLEWFCYTVPTSGSYDLAVYAYQATGTSHFDLLTFNNTLEYQTAANSLPHPADNASAGMASVGAVPYYNPTVLEPFSSQGPTSDGRTKPDLVGPDYVSSATYGSFGGTSASSPHVAGAAALVKQAFPTYTPANIRAYLESNAVDLGSPGKDNLFGAGRLRLPAPASDAVTIAGHVDLQGRTAQPGSPWVITTTLGLYPPDVPAPSYVYTTTTYTTGNFVLTMPIAGTDFVTGTYDLRVNGDTTLTRLLSSQPVTNTYNFFDFGALKEGDANGDNYVTILDFSLLHDSFGKCAGSGGYNAHTDFNKDGCTTILDFSLLRTNFGQGGE